MQTNVSGQQTQANTRQESSADRLIPMSEVETLTGLRKSSIYNLMRTGKFVRAVRLSARCTRWSHTAVQRWVQDRLAEAGGQ